MTIQSDLRKFLQEQGVTQKDFAEIVGINNCSLSVFMNRSGDSIAERIAPYLYGEKRHLVTPVKRENRG